MLDHTPATIGLMVDSRWVCAAQVRGRPPAGRASVRFERSEPDGPLSAGEARRIMGALERHGFTGRRIALAAPESQMLSATLHLPSGIESEAIESVVRLEMSRTAACPAGELEAGHVVVASGERQKQRRSVYAAALRHEHADALLQPLLEAGADVVAIEPADIAALRALHRVARPGAGAVTTVLDIGWDRAQALVTIGGRFAYARADAELGMGPLVDRIARLTGLPLPVAQRAALRGAEGPPVAQRQVSELAKRLGLLAEGAQAYVFHEHPAASEAGLLTHGAGAAVPGLVSEAMAPLDLDPVCVTPTMVCPFAGGLHEDHPALITAIGLSLEPEEAA